MGLFESLFGGKQQTNVETVPDRIWMTTEAKFSGLAKAVNERSNSGTVAILLVAHFPDVLSRLEALANRQNTGMPVRPVFADNLDVELATSLNLDATAIIDVMVGERHPLPSVDDRLEEFADKLPCRCRFSHHLSLEDAVMKVFAGESVQNILRKLGMSEDEPIESRMVSRRIRQAQQKIEGRAFGSMTAESATDWLQKNCPELGSH